MEESAKEEGSETVKLLEDLKQKFPMREVAPYGFYIVVPGPDFDPDWEVELGDQGVAVFLADLDQKPVTLVQIRRNEKSAETTRNTNDQKLKGVASNLLNTVWSQDDEKKLLKRMTELPGTVKEKCLSLSSEFESRSPAAIHQKYVKLQRRLKAVGVMTPKEEKGPEKAVHDRREIATVARHTKYKDDWQPEEDAFLIELHKKGLPYYKIAEQMREKSPSRTDQAVFYHIYALMRQGKIKHRFEHRKLRPAGAGKEPAAEPVHTSVDAPVPTSIPTSIPTPAKDEVVELLKQILSAIKPKEEFVCFESYCPSCREKRSVEDSNVWKSCPVCGGPLIVWNVKAGKEASK